MKPGRRFKTGAAAALTTAVVVALAVAVNLLAAALPSSITQLDISAGGLYTLGDSTKTLVSGLEKETVIYYLAQEGAEDSSVTTLLDRYAELSGKLSWQLKDPAVYPTFAHNYDDASTISTSTNTTTTPAATTPALTPKIRSPRPSGMSPATPPR